MIEGKVYHGIHAGCPLVQTTEVCKVAAMRLCPDGSQLLGALITASKAAHLVPCLPKFLYQFCSDETCRSCDKYTHRRPPTVRARPKPRKVHIRVSAS